MNADARDNQLVLNPPPDVAHAPSNVKDAAGGKSFTFIPIVIRNGMGTLVRAASTLVSTPGIFSPGPDLQNADVARNPYGPSSYRSKQDRQPCRTLSENCRQYREDNQNVTNAFNLVSRLPPRRIGP